MEEAPENDKESSHSAHGNGMNEWVDDGGTLSTFTVEMLHLLNCTNYNSN